MRAFLREYWLWILIPILLVVVAILLLAWLGNGETGFDYTVF
jgi:ABC-type dipeptide/oligopeptide/nickel transport system permease subunit